MRRHPSALTLPFAVAVFLALAGPAEAGPVATVARGVENKVETHQDRGSPPASPDYPEPEYRTDDGRYHDGGCFNCGSGVIYVSGAAASTVATGGTGGTSSRRSDLSIVTGPPRLDLYVGGHAVAGSEGAVIGEIRASQGWFGLSASDTSYFEEVEGGKRGSDSVRLDLMAFALNVRAIAFGSTELWIDGGLGASSSSEYDTILGTVFGLRAEHRLDPNLALVGQGRFFSLEYDVSAFEGWAGVRAWFLSAGYRAVRFNVGPPLHGPEAGIALRF
jgi:hypothetical protein